MASSSGQHVVDIDELSPSTKEFLQKLPPLSSDCRIYNAPGGMPRSKEEYFTPRIVSIGPIHYQKEKLMSMEHLKEIYLAEFLLLNKLNLEVCLQFILENETRLRNCYAHIIELDGEAFAKMILVDAAFLIMILLYNHFRSLVGVTDRIFGKPKLIREIKWDMILLENQLPIFILGDLYKFSKLQNTLIKRNFKLNFNEDTAMIALAHAFLRVWMSPKFPERDPPPVAEHILDLFRSCFIPPAADWVPQREKAETINMPTIKELYQSGVKIQAGSKKNMFDIKFHDDILEIPPIKIYDYTELIFRNLLAFELCHRPQSHHFFSDYLVMMRLFTLSSADSELLIKNAVIDNHLANADRVSTLFQNIGTGNLVNFSNFLYADVIKGLNEYYNVGWHRWKGSWKEKYFKAPWAICSVSAAVLLLVLTIVQTVFTILQVVLPK